MWDMIGDVTLYLLIAFGVVTLVISAIKKKWLWFAGIAGCFGSILTVEAISFITVDHSISTGYGAWLAESPLSAIAWIGAFSLAIISLIIHLIAYYFKDRDGD